MNVRAFCVLREPFLSVFSHRVETFAVVSTQEIDFISKFSTYSTIYHCTSSVSSCLPVPFLGRQFQALLDAFQQRAASKKPAQVTEEVTDESSSVVKEGDSEETWRRSLFGSPKKKLQARWEQVSPSVRQTLHRYSPRKLRELFAEEQTADENDTVMEDCVGASRESSQVFFVKIES